MTFLDMTTSVMALAAASRDLTVVSLPFSSCRAIPFANSLKTEIVLNHK